jgi:hypothetical protein
MSCRILKNKNMKNLKKLARNQMKEISGAGLIIIGCSKNCCPTDGKPRCPGLICPAVVCPQYV